MWFVVGASYFRLRVPCATVFSGTSSCSTGRLRCASMFNRASVYFSLFFGGRHGRTTSVGATSDWARTHAVLTSRTRGTRTASTTRCPSAAIGTTAIGRAAIATPKCNCADPKWAYGINGADRRGYNRRSILAFATSGPSVGCFVPSEGGVDPIWGVPRLIVVGG